MLRFRSVAYIISLCHARPEVPAIYLTGVPLLVNNCDGNNDISVLSYTIETRWWVPITIPSVTGS